jgi:serine/threonine protein kinase/tetratricopeptide (TPR) repeat protein
MSELDLFIAALERDDPAERDAYLAQACGGDVDLRRRVERLLRLHQQAGSFLEPPPAAPGETVDPQTGAFLGGPEHANAQVLRAADPTPPAEAAGTRLGPYKLLEKLGEGGMGAVWLAEQTEPIKRPVALKVIKPGMDSARVLRRFEAERQALALMDHTHIAKVFDAGSTPEGRPYFVMELVQGVPLTTYCDQQHLTLRERLELFVPVCQAIQHAHQKGIIHRDIKPSNVLVALQDGRPVPKVIDFGLAKALHQRLTDQTIYTEIGQVLGTLEYMSPEQADFDTLDVDTRADVSSLGVVLYELLTGTTPLNPRGVRRAAFSEVLRQIREVEPPRPSTRLTQSKESLASLGAQRRTDSARLVREVRGELDWIVMKCLEKDRTRRYPTANCLARDLERYLHDEPVEACPPSAGYLLRKFAWRYRATLAGAAAIAGAGVLILVLLGVGAWWWDRQAGEREKDRAVAAERDRQEALAALAHAEEVLARADLATADLALAQAENRIGEDSPADISALLATARRDRDLVRDLREIDDMGWAPGLISMADPAVMARRYQAVFARYGLDVGGTDLEVAAAAVQASRVSSALIAGLSEWFSADPKGPNLLLLLDRLDPDADRAAIRAAIQAGDAHRVKALVKALDGAKVPAWFAASVGFHPMVPHEDGVRLMTAAWRTHPANYQLAYRSSLSLGEMREKRSGDMLTWARVAVALRPDSPFAHNLLGFTWRGMRNWDEAEASARRAIELSRKYPRYAGAHVGLGNVMLEKGDLNGAEASYRAALAIDPDSPCYFNMGLVCERRGDLAGAEEWHRKAVAVAPSKAYFREVLDGIVRKRALLTRLDEVAAGRAQPATPAEAIEFAILAARPPKRRYGLGVRLYSEAFAADPALADPLKYPHCYWAACDAVRAATGKDTEMTALGVEEWGYFTGQALKRLRADLAVWTSQAKDPKEQPQVGETLNSWKEEPALAPVRDPASLAAMPLTDRKAWETLWRDVDALLASTIPRAEPPPAQP